MNNRINISLAVLASILVGVAVIAGIIGVNIAERSHATLRNDYLKLAGEVNKYKADLNSCNVMTSHYKTLYDLNK